MLTGPTDATQRLLERTGLKASDIDVAEINEAFASVVLAWQKELGFSPEQTNPNGGAIALGHPLGGTGAVLLTKALHELERTGGRYGLVSRSEEHTSELQSLIPISYPVFCLKKKKRTANTNHQQQNFRSQ